MVERPPELPSSAPLVTRPPERMQQRRLHPLPLPTTQQLHVQTYILATTVTVVMSTAVVARISAAMVTTPLLRRTTKSKNKRKTKAKLLPTALQVCHASAMSTTATAPQVTTPEEPPPKEAKIVFNRPLLKAGGKEEAAKIRKFQKFWKILGTVRKVTTSTSSVYSNL